MSKVFIIPDVHLKPWMFTKAAELIKKGDYDEIVFLGDLVDDWGQQENEKLYNEAFDAAEDFLKYHRNNMLFCYGNHDVSYLWTELESGFSWSMKSLVEKRMPELTSLLPPEQVGFVHHIDGVWFSHAGITEKFVEYQFGLGWDISVVYMLDRISKMDKGQLWTDESPIWARPQEHWYGMKPYEECEFQVVGHTPVKVPLLEGNFLTLDTFSTYSDGTPIGDCRFVWIDTETKEWHYAE